MSVLPLPPAPASSVTPAPPTLPGSLTLPASRAAIMGILNVTPDSFSDGGRYADAPAAHAHPRAIQAAGAHLNDHPGAPGNEPAGAIGRAGEHRIHQQIPHV